MKISDWTMMALVVGFALASSHPAVAQTDSSQSSTTGQALEQEEAVTPEEPTAEDDANVVESDADVVEGDAEAGVIVDSDDIVEGSDTTDEPGIDSIDNEGNIEEECDVPEGTVRPAGCE